MGFGKTLLETTHTLNLNLAAAQRHFAAEVESDFNAHPPTNPDPANWPLTLTPDPNQVESDFARVHGRMPLEPIELTRHAKSMMEACHTGMRRLEEAGDGGALPGATQASLFASPAELAGAMLAGSVLQVVLADFQRTTGRNPADAAEVLSHVSTVQHAASPAAALQLSASGVASLPMLEALSADFAARHDRAAYGDAELLSHLKGLLLEAGSNLGDGEIAKALATAPLLRPLLADFEVAHGHPPTAAAEVMAHLKAYLGCDNLATSGGKALVDSAASAPMLQALNDDFGLAHGRAPADVAELLGHMQGVAFDAAMMGGGKHVPLSEGAGGAAASMPAPLMRTLSDDFEAIYSRPPASENERIELLSRLVEHIDQPIGSLCEKLPPNLQEALYFQIAAAQHTSSSESEADGDQLSLLKALVERPEGAAAAVVVLQDRMAAHGHHHPALPRQVSVAIAEEFRKVHGVAPPSEAEAVAFLKQMLSAPASDAEQGTFYQKEASPFASSAASSSFEAPRSLMGLPPAVQLAVQHEFTARFGAAPTEDGEVMALFGKSLLDEYASNARSFESFSEAASPVGSPETHDASSFHPGAQLRKGSSTGTFNSAADISRAPSGVYTPPGGPSRRSSTGRFSAAARAVRVSGCRHLLIAYCSHAYLHLTWNTYLV